MSGSETITKRCRQCLEDKPLEDFYRASGSETGRRARCKRCYSQRARAWYLKNKKRVRANSSRWYEANRARHKQLVDAWRWANPDRVRASAAKTRARYPERELARRAVGLAILAGQLVPQPCRICGLKPKKVNGRQRIEAHHHKGYDPEFWRDVEWLCVPHHKEADRLAGGSHGADAGGGAP